MMLPCQLRLIDEWRYRASDTPGTELIIRQVDLEIISLAISNDNKLYEDLKDFKILIHLKLATSVLLLILSHISSCKPTFTRFKN